MDAFLKGGFAYLILLNLAAFIRSAFKARALEVRLARQLRVELREDVRNVEAFCASLHRIIATNETRRQQREDGWVYDSAYVRPLATKYIRNSDNLFALLSTHAPEAINALHVTLHRLAGYEQVLGSHDSYFLRARATIYQKDPHTVLLNYAHSWGLFSLAADLQPLLLALDRIEKGTLVWQVLKKPWAYWPARLTLFVLLMAVPARAEI